ncbi:MAG: helix-turn-helix transcriptional regulator [Phycisphaerae bacterium]|nr:helix-turn-helix transcriptional regulator [Phycisphaerae bacterium]
MTHWLNHISPNLRNVGSARYTAGWVEPQRLIHDHQLVLFAEGEFDVEFSSCSYPRGEGTFLIVPPGELHVTRMTSRAGRRCWVHFDWVVPRETIQRPLISYPPKQIVPGEMVSAPRFVPREVFQGPVPSPAALEIHARLDSLWNTERLHEQLLCRGIFLQLLVELFGPGASDALKPAGRSGRLAQAIRARLDGLADLPIEQMPSLQKELQSLGSSYAHACRVFHAAFGLSPLAYTHRLRVERAKWLLREGGRTVAQVGRAVGVENPAYFSRLFRKIAGLSPRRYAATSTTDSADRP